MKKLIIEESKQADKEGKYILFLYSETSHGINYRRLFKGTKKACLEYKKKLINGI